jgi:hypothetical protein
MASCVSAHLREEGKALVNVDESGANALNFVQVFKIKIYLIYPHALIPIFFDALEPIRS